jgi:C4-dicarboxylate-specific signal transduction histidine kinase
LGDAIQIQQVLINLLNNAIDAICSSDPKFREIKISIESNDHFAIIDIEDTGPGIDMTMLPAMFELYKTSKKDGLGIGLWLCKTIMHKHHGEITAANSQNGGARFTIQLPLALAPS